MGWWCRGRYRCPYSFLLLTSISRPLGQPGQTAPPGGSPPMRVHDHGFPAYISSAAPSASRKAGRFAARKRRFVRQKRGLRSEEHTSELQSLMRISYAVFCLKKKKQNNTTTT